MPSKYIGRLSWKKGEIPSGTLASFSPAKKEPPKKAIGQEKQTPKSVHYYQHDTKCANVATQPVSVGEIKNHTPRKMMFER